MNHGAVAAKECFFLMQRIQSSSVANEALDDEVPRSNFFYGNHTTFIQNISLCTISCLGQSISKRDRQDMFDLKASKLFSEFKFIIIQTSSQFTKSQKINFIILVYSLLALCKNFVRYIKTLMQEFLRMRSRSHQTKER